MSTSQGFGRMRDRLDRKDASAFEEIYSRYVRRLTGLARCQFDSGIRNRGDAEDVVQSVYRSFIARDTSHYRLEDWEAIWKLLAVITVRKCWKRRARFRKESLVPLPDWHDEGSSNSREWAKLIDHAPTPAEAAALTETVSQLLKPLDENDRAMGELILQGYTAVEIADQFECSEKTVRRLRDRFKAQLSEMTGEDGRG